MPSTEAPFADAAALVASCLAAFLPPDRVSVAEYATLHRELRNEGGGFVGRWDNAQVPYLVGPMDALTGTEYLTVVIVGPGQCGKTTVAENWLLHSVGADPGDLLWYMQTDKALQDYVKNRINPMIQSHEVMRSRLGAKPIDNSIGFKNFTSMRANFLSAAMSNLISRSAPRIVVDEEDAYDAALGDVGELVDVRRQSFGRESKVLRISHPDRAKGLDPKRDWTAGIMRAYAPSTRCTWWWACPECGAWSSPNPNAARVMVLDYPDCVSLDEIAEQTRLVCPVNGCMIEDRQRAAMNAGGRWLAHGQEIEDDGQVTGTPARSDTAGFWIMGVMSPFLIGGIGELARARVQAQRIFDQDGDDTALRQILPKKWSIPYSKPRRVGSLDAAAIADRAEPGLALGTVPEGVRFLTAFADVQANRFELLVRGWGERGESWIVDYRVIMADPASSAADWDQLLGLLTGGEWPLADRSGRVMRLRAAGYDMGGAPGVTTEAYDAWRRWKGARATGRRIARHGRSDGRDMWSVIPTKGLGTPNAQRLQVVYPDTNRKDRMVAAGGQIPVALFAANGFKDDLAGQLARDTGPWSVHIPAGLRAASPPHPFFEGLVAEARTARGTWEKTGSARNEPLDLMVGTHVVAHLHGLARIDWARPPGWAAAWDANALVTAPSASLGGLGQHSAGLDPLQAPMPSARMPKPPMPVSPQAYNPAQRRATLASRLVS